MKKLLFLTLISYNLQAQTPGAGVTDVVGNQYPTVIIGSQEWMAENLRTSKYADGSVIPNVTDASQWNNLTTGAWVHYNHESKYENPYGKLYNWYTVNNLRGLCPSGWHVPSDGEWTVLINYLGGESVAGVKMKSTGSQYWSSPNQATNESGFSGLPGGLCDIFGDFIDIADYAYWWSATGSDTYSAYYRGLVYGNGDVDEYIYAKNTGFSVRCLKGVVAGIENIELPKKEVIKITDLLGRETEFKPNTVLIYVYSDGSTEKILNFE